MEDWKMNMKKWNVAPLGLAASLLAGLLVTACSDRNETVTKTETSTTVVEATPTQQDPVMDSGASSSAATSGVDSGMATDTTDAMSGTAPVVQAPAAEHKIIPKRHAKHVKKVKKTKTTSRVERSENVGARSPIYDRNDVVVAEPVQETASGATTGAGEISTPMGAPVRAPGRFASANTDWGVVYEINNPEAASTP
jgi:hypothetical protein